MIKLLLEQAATEILAGVDLSSRSSTKFLPLAKVFADFLSLDSARIGVKRLRDPKNYGNRISEATGTEVELLVLIADQDVDQNAVRRALEGRAVELVPTLLVVRRLSKWLIDFQYVPKGRTPPLPGIPVVEIARQNGRDAEPHGLPEVSERILALVGLKDEAVVRSRIASLSNAYPNLIFKRVGEHRNLKNRIREATGRRPSHLVVLTSEKLIDAARSALRSVTASDGVACYLIWMGSDGAFVQQIGPDAGSSEVRHPSNDDLLVYDGERMEGSVTEVEGLAYRQLERVKQIHRFLPLNANAENLFEEHLAENQRLRYETRTIAYLKRLIAKSRRCVIVLTGNAGHGKTHMCFRLLEGAVGSEGISTLLADIEGSKGWAIPDASLPVRIVKDLSELEPPMRAAEILSDLVTQDEMHAIVCANEGRLRDVVSRSPQTLQPILDALDRGLDRGETSPASDDSIQVINLNFQAAVAGDGGFLKHVLAHFLDNQAAWNVCARCRAHPDCPIRGNRMDLTLSPSAERDNHDSRTSLMELVRIAEETGYVLTYRETLVLVAYLITGGLTCAEVERRHRDGRRRDSLKRFGLLDLLFDAPLSEDESEILRVLHRIKRLDPGRIALRPVDEELHCEMEEEGRLGAGVFGEDSVQLRTKRDLDREVEEYRALVRQARRRAWLRSSEIDEERLGVSRSERLGLSHHKTFRALQEGPADTELVEILRRLVKGLHTIQGAVNIESKTSLRLVDPSFGRSGNHSAIIARSLRIKDLDLWPESRWWRHRRGDETPPVMESVEWIDRRLLLVDRSNEEVLLSLDLAAFEFVMAAADGVVMREFNAADRRRVLTRLAHHAEKGRHDESDAIRVLLERGDGTLTVERDGTILLERT